MEGIKLMKQATYRFVFYPEVKGTGRYIGIAWNYDEAVLISTTDYDTHTEAQKELKRVCADRDVELRWFDGEYEWDKRGGSLVQAKLKQIYPDGIDK
jgi:hypothetical protein